jgi:hypothetical protein
LPPAEYVPAPIDTSSIQLPKEIDDVLEQLAKNSHEVWAQQRMKDGWRYGPQRDDKQKIHPDLVPYEELPESERVYDRRMASETLKVIVALGYSITK